MVDTRSGWRAAVIAAALIATTYSAQRSIAARTCDQVVSYVRWPSQGSKLTQNEWRLFDPASGRDVLFLSNTRGFSGVRWDTTFHQAWFSSGDLLYSVEWKIGATPRLISKLPETQGPAGWWFNPDSSCWQLAALRPVGPEALPHRYWCELWQSTRDASHWRIVRADTVPCEAVDCGDWPWYGQAFTREACVITQEQLFREAAAIDLLDQIAPFDTATISIVSNDADPYWRFIALKSAPRRGIAFRLMESNTIVVSPPFFLVDLDKKTKRLLIGDEQGWSEALLSDKCGLILLPHGTGTPFIIDGASGSTVFSQPSNSSKDAVWVRAPREK